MCMGSSGSGRAGPVRGRGAVRAVAVGDAGADAGAADDAFVHSEPARGGTPHAAHAAGYSQAVGDGRRAPAGRPHL